MHMTTKNDISTRYKDEYWNANKARKSEILNHVEDVVGMNRKSIIRKFHCMQVKDSSFPETRGRPVVFTKDADAALKDVWEIASEPCGELLFPLIREYVAVLQRDRLWKHGDIATGKLLAMKEHTVRRRVLSFERVLKGGKGLSGTKPSLLKSIIPIFSGPWEGLPPGFGQIDTVAHCGSSLLGDFIWSVNYTDSATYWMILRAQWNKGKVATWANLVIIQKMLPVVLLGIHPDTGSEFINWTLKDWCESEYIDMTRSEPGKKNHNMYVEERNGHVVRKFLGYTRLDQKVLVDMVNELYDVLALYLNHFQAVRRTLSKERVGAKYRRTFEKIPLTPYQRMLAHSLVTDGVKKKLREEHEKLNPLLLKKEVDRLVRKIFKTLKTATESDG